VLQTDPAFKGASAQDVFVLKNGVAEKRTVHIGMTNFDYVELKDNVKPGDVVITSDMKIIKIQKKLLSKIDNGQCLCRRHKM
jgi:HlyD family secretion protein